MAPFVGGALVVVVITKLWRCGGFAAEEYDSL
jgi:hypothetical protein